jgi:hypothetical protein
MEAVAFDRLGPVAEGLAYRPEPVGDSAVDGYVTPAFREDFPEGVVPIEHVLGGTLLEARWDECGDFAEAFCEHYALITEGYDAAHAEGRLPDQQWIDVPERIEPDQYGEHHGTADPENYFNRLRGALMPHYGKGVTMTDLADRTGKPIEDVVSALYRIGVSDAVYSAAVEDVIVASDLPIRRLAEELGVGKRVVHHFTKLHRQGGTQ